MARTTMATLLERIATLEAALTSAPVATSKASQHFKDRDLAVTCCAKLFRSAAGVAFHVANTHPDGKAK